MSDSPCPVCRGRRLKMESLAVTVGGSSIYDFTTLPVSKALAFMEGLTLTRTQAMIADQILKEIRSRLGFLRSVGLQYLTLSRSAATLSGGESQRIRLATQIGSSLMGVLYILDEPSIGLHQRDNDKLLETLCQLRDLGNTLIVVEHDEDTMRSADYIIDVGPGAGVHGGRIIAAGTPEEVSANPASLTGQYLSGRRSIAVPEERRPGSGKVLTIRGASENNLRDVDVSIPLGTLTCVTGVSGSGKSSLVNEILFKRLGAELNRMKCRPGKHRDMEGIKHLDKVVGIDQSPIGRTPRSNPATYTGGAAGAPAGELRGQLHPLGLAAGEGGGGLPHLDIPQPNVAQGLHLHRNLGQGLEELLCLLGGHLQHLIDVLALVAHLQGLPVVPLALAHLAGHVDVRQEVHLDLQKPVPGAGLAPAPPDVEAEPARPLSGGEAQRVKLATELSRRSTGSTIYILDEPTTGLHTDDVGKLLEVLQRLVEAGNTVVVIEHNLDVIKCADHIIDLGPEGGDGGGSIVCTGTPEEVAACPASYTGQYLRKVLP